MEKHFTVKATSVMEGYEYEFDVKVTNDDHGEILDWYEVSFDDENLHDHSESMDEVPTAEQVAEFVERYTRRGSFGIVVESVEER